MMITDTQRFAEYIRLHNLPVLLVMILCAGCVNLPDADDMSQLRAQRSATRMHELSDRVTTADSEYLEGELQLSEAIAKALARNLTLRNEREELEIARGRIQQSYAEVLPKLDLVGSYLFLDEEMGASRDQYRIGVKLIQPLLNNTAGPAMRSSRLYRLRTMESVRRAEETLHYEVIKAYYNAVLSEHLLKVNILALETAERQLADTQARRRQGMASNYDELRAEVEVSNFRAQVLQARNNKDVAFTALFRLIGASPGSEVRLVDLIPPVSGEIPFETALHTALEQRADLKVAEYAVQLQRENVAAIRNRYYPTLSGYFSQAWANPDPHDPSRDEWGDEWQAGLELRLSVFDGLGRSGELIQECARLRQYEIVLRDAEEQVISEVRQLALSLNTAKEFAISQSRNLETAREAVRLVETGMREGQNTPVEVMDARQALTTASANYYRSLFDHAVTWAALKKAMGVLASDNLPGGAVAEEP